MMLFSPSHLVLNHLNTRVVLMGSVLGTALLPVSRESRVWNLDVVPRYERLGRSLIAN